MTTNKKAKKRVTRSIHKRIALHPISIFILLCAGVIIIASIFPTKADSYIVTAKVSAPLVTMPAVITSFHDQDHTGDPVATISGTCSSQTAYVTVTIDNTPVGTSDCSSSFFAVKVTLQPGANNLQAIAYNSTDDQGPTNPPITVFYDVAVAPSRSTISSRTLIDNPTQSAPAISALTLMNNYRYQVHRPGELWRWDIQISGGTPPYALTVNWGDGLSLPDETVEPATSITHMFSQAGIYHITVTASDTGGRSASLQLLAIVQPYPAVPSVISNLLQDVRTYLWVIWPTYAVVALMVTSFWLGESQGVAVAVKSQLIRRFKIRK